eukprot:s5765_g3.t1
MADCLSRKDLRQEHRSVQRANNFSLLRLFFKAWQKGEVSPDDLEETDLAQHLLSMQDVLIWQARRKLDRNFKTLKRQEWKSWVNQQLENKIEKMRHARASDIYQILKPKKMVDKKKGKHHRPLPGMKDQHGQWRSSRADIAFAWDEQFSAIELAVEVEFDSLLQRSKAIAQHWQAENLLDIPTIYELESSLRMLNEKKAPGLDGLGAEVWQLSSSGDVERIFVLLLKAALRQQSMPEMSGGWLLPLHKEKFHASLMEGYRAILLEPSLARAFSKSWRGRLTSGLESIAVPLQQGGRKGLGIEP